MVNVDAMDGIRYGIGLIKYILLVAAGGVLISAVGMSMADGGDQAAGLLVAVLGTLVVWAGMLGLLYKVIADGVERGVSVANGRLDPNAE